MVTILALTMISRKALGMHCLQSYQQNSTCLLDVKQVAELKKTISNTVFKYGKKKLTLTAISWTIIF
jgi:hypothetical protein